MRNILKILWRFWHWRTTRGSAYQVDERLRCFGQDGGVGGFQGSLEGATLHGPAIDEQHEVGLAPGAVRP